MVSKIWPDSSQNLHLCPLLSSEIGNSNGRGANPSVSFHAEGGDVRDISSGARLVTVNFAAIMEQVQRPLYSYLCHLLGDEEQARDIGQDTLCEAWRVARQGAPPFGSESTEADIRRWLFAVAHARAVNALRRRRLIRWESLDQPEIDESAYPRAPLAFEDQVAEGLVLRAALAHLPVDHAVCLLLNIVQGFSAAEIAQIMGITPEASKKRLSRARQRLRAAYFAEDSLEESLEDSLA